ncbi:MAG: hypothetical protein ACO2OV_08735 [Thermoproteota archaeon]|jgi:hypothetical protein
MFEIITLIIAIASVMYIAYEKLKPKLYNAFENVYSENFNQDLINLPFDSYLNNVNLEGKIIKFAVKNHDGEYIPLILDFLNNPEVIKLENINKFNGINNIKNFKKQINHLLNNIEKSIIKYLKKYNKEYKSINKLINLYVILLPDIVYYLIKDKLNKKIKNINFIIVPLSNSKYIINYLINLQNIKNVDINKIIKYLYNAIDFIKDLSPHFEEKAEKEVLEKRVKKRPIVKKSYNELLTTSLS